jgi:hypothetical protein
MIKCAISNVPQGVMRKQGFHPRGLCKRRQMSEYWPNKTLEKISSVFSMLTVSGKMMLSQDAWEQSFHGPENDCPLSLHEEDGFRCRP